MKTGADTKGTASELIETLFLFSSDIAVLFKRPESTIRRWASACNARKKNARKKKDGNRVKYYLKDPQMAMVLM